MPVPVASSQMILPILTKLLVVPSSNIKLSSASELELSVPSIAREPSTTEIKPVASLTTGSEVVVPSSVVNVTVSPTQYFEPASSTITLLTLPLLIEPTSAVAVPFPIAV